jgi:hypothetical protein
LFNWLSPWKNRSYQTPSYTPNTTCNRYVYGGAINFIQDFQFDSRDWLGEKTPFSTPPRPTADIQNFQPFTPGSWNALQAVVAQIQSVPILQSLDPLLLNPIFPLEANIIDQFKGIDSCPVDGCNYVFLPCNVTTTGGDIPVVKISCQSRFVRFVKRTTFVELGIETIIFCLYITTISSIFTILNAEKLSLLRRTSMPINVENKSRIKSGAHVPTIFFD